MSRPQITRCATNGGVDPREPRTIGLLGIRTFARAGGAGAVRGRVAIALAAMLAAAPALAQTGAEDALKCAGSDAAAKIVGCTALTIIWADLAEIRSLAVDESQRGRGVGRKLVEWTMAEARRLHIRRIMALTYEQSFFEKLGFEVVEKNSLPLKVWSDCVRCPKRDGCDEIAVVRTLHDVPEISMPAATPTPRGVSIPVIED